MQFAEQEITQITEMIWLSILGMPTHRTASSPTELHGQDTWMGTVHISGEWQGVVVLQCPAALARKAAHLMFSQPEEVVSVNDVQDAIGEITNMIGGNIKALLPEPSLLSLPTMVEGKDYYLRVPGTCEVSRLTFACEEWPFVVTLLQREGEAK